MTVERLIDTRLIDIHRPLSWTFTNTTVVIQFEGQPIPSDVVEALLGPGSTAVLIEASWQLDENAKTLCLSDMKADSESMDKEVTIAIAPAGQIRVNLGSRQYNMSRDRTKSP